jgi:iSTAND domain-containing protein
MAWKWSTIDHLGLTYFVNADEARGLVSPNVNPLDLRQQNRIREIVGAIYEDLLSKGIKYALEPSSSSERVQDIRTHSEVIKFQEGTCLDLALLFCGVCLAFELLPVLIILHRHAFVAVSLNYDLYALNRRAQREGNLFENILAGQDKADSISELIGNGTYLAIECTGFARSQSLLPPHPEGIDRQRDGTLTFDRAIEAAEEHFFGLHRRDFQFALDIATAHRYWDMKPLLESEQRGRSFQFRGIEASPEFNPLPYLLDRSEQEKATKKAVLEHRISSPQRPLICVVHGDEYECHDEFMDRIEKISLPTILASWYPEEVKRIPPLRRQMKLSLKEISDSNWEEMFWQDLAEAIIGDRTGARDRVINLISSHKVAVIIYTPFLSEELDGGLLDRLRFFFEFWDRWQDLSEKLLLFVCLGLKYQRRYDVKRRRYQIWKSEGLNYRLRRYVKELNFKDYENLHGLCLPELEAIPQADAEAAVNHELVIQRYGLRGRDVRRIYNQPNLCTPEGRIPMDNLLDQLLSHSRVD